jgi:crotonobetainyl-CoA:carnitine CoA-transferase CaiB-like acyl-CoA transferase
MLSGVKVVELGQGISAPYCARLLADLGAEVIKVEPPTGDPSRRNGPFPGDVPDPERSGLFLYLNLNKRGVTLDLTKPNGRRLLHQLLERADILVENRAPAEMERWELDYATLRQRYPGLIVASITPFGQYGSYRDYKAYDINASAIAGISFSVGEPGRPPLAPPLSQIDYQGALAAAAGTTAALVHRNATGRGQQVDVSPMEILATIHSGGTVLTYTFLGVTGHRGGHRRPDLYPTTMLPCKDGYVCLIAREGKHWKKFLEALGNPEWTQNPRYRDRRTIAENYPDEMDGLLAPYLMNMTKQEFFEICREHRLPFGPVRSIDEVANDRHLAERGFWEQVRHDVAGEYPYAGRPYKLAYGDLPAFRPAPTLGQHNAEVYGEQLGYPPEELARLRQGGVI